MVEATARVDTSSTESMNFTTKETPQVTEKNTEGTAQPSPEPTSEFETSTVKIQTTSKPVIPNKSKLSSHNSMLLTESYQFT